jgi:undecaprenyl-diphosphatase
VQAVGTWWFLVLIALVVLAGLAARRQVRRIRAIVLVIVVVLVVVSLGKLLIRNPPVSHALGRPIGSFPSGHTADVTAIVGVLLVALVPVRFRLVPYAVSVTLGVLVGSSRVITGAHTPDDVLAGWLLGWALVFSAGAYLAAGEAGGSQLHAQQSVDEGADESRR